MDDAAARELLIRLGTFLDQFAGCFGRRAQRNGASRYLQGLLNDSERKSMEPMHGRLSDAGTSQGLQHVITHSPWDVRPLWRRLRAALPFRAGILALDETSFPKQGRHSVGVKRQCSYPGWHHHAVLAALTFTFLQLERRRHTTPLPTFPEVRNLVREIMVTLFMLERPSWLHLLVSFQRNPPLRI